MNANTLRVLGERSNLMSMPGIDQRVAAMSGSPVTTGGDEFAAECQELLVHRFRAFNKMTQLL
jgi:hypothetical protein